MSWSHITDAISSFMTDHGFTIAGIVIGFYFLHRLVNLGIEKLIRRAVVSDEATPLALEEQKRERTLVAIFEAAIDVFLIIVAGVMILGELGINTGALLAGFGIAGIAVGFGAQYLIKDLIAGFFVLLENQYRVGDVVCFGETCGLVERISLRMTVLRDLDGAVHHVPNGEVRLSSNLSKYHANVNINVGVAYSSDLEQVIATVNRVGNELAEDADWKGKIRTPPQFLRVDDFADSAIVIKIVGETQPLQQWDIAGELRKRLKLAFDQEGIEIPFPQRVMHQVQH
jgi:small-conductance mechanosensitive channel